MRFLADPNTRYLDEAAIGAAVSALVLMWGLLQWRRVARADIAMVASLGLGFCAFFIVASFAWLVVFSSLAVGVYALRRAEPVKLAPDSACDPVGLKETLGIFIPLMIIAALLLYRLGSLSPAPFAWEASTMLRLVDRLKSSDPIGMLLKSWILWNQQVLADGVQSLLFGAPAYFLSNYFGLSLLLMRAISVFWILGAIYVFSLIFRGGYGYWAPLVAGMVFGLNEMVLILGRYGSSIASTIFSVTLALYLGFRLVERREIPCAFLFSLALLVATQGYSPARISVLILLGSVPFCLLFVKCARLRKFILALVILVIAGSMLLFQHAHGRHKLFLSARGEQFFSMMKHPSSLPIKPALLPSNSESGEMLSEMQYLSLAWQLVRTVTGPQLLHQIDPFSKEKRSRFPSEQDPPFLKIFAPALFPFLAVGFLAMWKKGRRLRGFTCLALMVLGGAPLLLTNRADSYRTIFMTIPVSIWITAGVSELIEVALRFRMPRGFIYGGIALGLVCGVAPRIEDFYSDLPFPTVEETTTLKALQEISGPVLVAVRFDFRIESVIQVKLFERFQQTAQPSDFWQDSLVNQLLDSQIDSSSAVYTQLVEFVDRGGVVLVAPSQEFKTLATKLRQSGYMVRSNSNSRLSIWALSRSDLPAISDSSEFFKVVDAS